MFSKAHGIDLLPNQLDFDAISDIKNICRILLEIQMVNVDAMHSYSDDPHLCGCKNSVLVVSSHLRTL